MKDKSKQKDYPPSDHYKRRKKPRDKHLKRPEKGDKWHKEYLEDIGFKPQKPAAG